MNRSNEYGTDEYWEARRAELLRAARQRRLAHLVNAVVNAVLAMLAIGFVILLAWYAGNRRVTERAAYLEGRFSLDRATAMTLAESEVMER